MKKTMAEYGGPERRQSYLDLNEALQKVELLHGAVGTLATAVTNTVPRQEIEALKVEVRRDFQIKLYFMSGLSAIIILILMFFINLKIDNANQSVKHGHAVIECLLGQPEAARTGTLAATSLVTCEQTVKP